MHSRTLDTSLLQSMAVFSVTILLTVPSSASNSPNNTARISFVQGPHSLVGSILF